MTVRTWKEGTAFFEPNIDLCLITTNRRFHHSRTCNAHSLHVEVNLKTPICGQKQECSPRN